MSDKELIFAIKNNDNEAFKALFSKYYGSLVGYVRTYTNDIQAAEDIVQQLFVDIWAKREKLNITESVKGFLYTVAYRTYINSLRGKVRRNNFFDELKEKMLRASIEEDKELAQKRIEKLRSIINTLPPKCKEILELSKFSGLKYSEIAEKLDVSQKTVEAQMRIAYTKIREGFKNEKLILLIISDFFNLQNSNTNSFG
jgi:RNA polymerase sigma-70 factor (ECF subfamily)